MTKTDPAAEAYIRSLNVAASPKDDPPAGESRGSGASSHSSGDTSSSGSGGGGYPPAHRSGGGGGSSGGGDSKVRPWSRILLLVSGVISAFGSLWWVTHDTPPNRAATEQKYLAVQLVDAETARIKAQVKLERERARANQAQTPAVAATTSAPVSGSCFSPEPGATLYANPLRLSTGSCVQLPIRDQMYFWAVFQAVPSSMVGVAEIAAVHDVGNRTPDGRVIPVRTGEACVGDCTAFLTSNLGKVVFVRQSQGQNLQLNF